jgi:hypothetical protein
LIVLQVSNRANILVCSLFLMEKCQNDSWKVIALFGNYTICTRTVLLLHIADSNCDKLYCHTSTLPTGAATGLIAHPHYVTLLVFMIYCRTLLNFWSHSYTSTFRKWGYISLPSAVLVWSLASLPAFICLCYTWRGRMYRISASSSEGSGRFAEMAVRVPEVMQVPCSAGHLDAVWMGQDLCAFHLAINVYSSETEQTFTEQFIFCLWVWRQWGEHQGELSSAWNREAGNEPLKWKWAVQSKG